MQKYKVILCVTVQFLLCFHLNLRAISEYKPPGACGGAIYRKGFLAYEFGGLINYLEGLLNGGAYFWNFTVCLCVIRPCCLSMIFQIAGDL